MVPGTHFQLATTHAASNIQPIPDSQSDYDNKPLFTLQSQPDTQTANAMPPCHAPVMFYNHTVLGI